jgi:hypothetical protein
MKILILSTLLLLSGISFGQWFQDSIKFEDNDVYERFGFVMGNNIYNYGVMSDYEFINSTTLILRNIKQFGLTLSFNISEVINSKSKSTISISLNGNHYTSPYFYFDDKLVLFGLFENNENFVRDFKSSKSITIFLDKTTYTFNINNGEQVYNFVTYKN